MSLSRQVFSSPFDVPQRPRTAASRQNGDRKRVKEGGSSLATNSNIMVDTRVVGPCVVRRSTLNGTTVKKNASEHSNEDQRPGCILFDSRLIRGDVFANPIVTVTGQQHENKKRGRGTSAFGHRAMTTPPPVKGRRHVSVQTDDIDTSTVGACKQSPATLESCVQTELCCALKYHTFEINDVRQDQGVQDDSIEGGTSGDDD
mmetsp:Transcript_7257/g.18036  ORF Transcript_7257/g.18036 Transcript_7257/m.18036 type:complete len:202 (+) Transcript_7257:156-761(+)